jgi:hypothetical protein
MLYQRAQVVSALWSAFVIAGPFTVSPVPLKPVPKTFVRRVGNLLDKGVGITPEKRAGKKGVFQEYSAEDVIELGIGLSMLNVGLPQSAAVFYLTSFRDELRRQIATLPAATVGKFPPRFLVVRPRALRDSATLYVPLPERNSDGVDFFRPSFVCDWDTWTALAMEMEGGPTNELILIEIGELARRLHQTLPETRISNRGRH